jgi:hypothetical protein
LLHNGDSKEAVCKATGGGKLGGDCNERAGRADVAREALSERVGGLERKQRAVRAECNDLFKFAEDIPVELN